MKEFPIKFSFTALNYSARVTTFGPNSQFHVSGFIPEIGGIEIPYVIYKKKNGVYSWSVSKDVPQELGQVIFEAIKKSQKLQVSNK